MRNLLLATLALCTTQPSDAAAQGDLKTRWRPTKSVEVSERSVDGARALILKLRDDSRAIASEGRLRSGSGGVDVARVDALLGFLPGVAVRPAIDAPRDLLQELRSRAQAAAHEEMADLSQVFRVTSSEPSLLVTVVEPLLALDEVENVYGEPEIGAASLVVGGLPTPSLTSNQFYSTDIQLAAAQADGYLGAGVVIADIEGAWDLPIAAMNWTGLGHEDLSAVTFATLDDPSVWIDDSALPPIVVPLGQSDFEHGTATLGVLFADADSKGLTGLTPDAELRVVSDTIQDPALPPLTPLKRLLTAIVLATDALDRGDLILIERHAEGPNHAGGVGQSALATGWVPVEYTDAEFYCIRQATALGIHVIEPAGNGFQDLDETDPASGGDPTYPSVFDLASRDSGAVMVSGVDHYVEPPDTFTAAGQFMNVGRRVDAYSHGVAVASLGTYRFLYPLPVGCPGPMLFPALWYCTAATRAYTRAYQGTSSASAIVTGAAALLEEAHETLYGEALRPHELRSIFRTSGRALPSTIVGSTKVGREPRLSTQLDLLEMGPHFAQVQYPAEITVCDFAQQWQDFGESVAIVGDVDSDGIGDYLVNYDYTDPFSNSKFRQNLYSGRSGDRLSFVQTFAQGRLAAAGDTNGNGREEWIFWPQNVELSQMTARVYEYDPATGGSSVLFTTNPHFGKYFGGIGDINGDGFDDIHVNGRVYLGPNGADFIVGGTPLSGVAGGLLDLDADGRTEFYTTSGTIRAVNDIAGTETLVDLYVNSGFAGNLITSVGDIDLDSVPDFVTSDDMALNSVGQVAGKLWVYSGATGAQLAEIEGTAGFELGDEIAGPGDMDGDGRPDILAAAPGAWTNRGRVFLYSGADFSLLYEYEPETPAAGQRFGEALSVGRINRDALGDFLVGTPDLSTGLTCVSGRAYLFNGWQPDLVAAPDYIEAADIDGDSYGGQGTHNKSFLEIDVGASHAGEPYVILGGVSGSHPGVYTDGLLIPVNYDAITSFLLAIGPTTPPTGTFVVKDLFGTLDAGGRGVAEFGPIDTSLLCGIVGAEFVFSAVAWDLVTFGLSVATGPATVRIQNDFPSCP